MSKSAYQLTPEDLQNPDPQKAEQLLRTVLHHTSVILWSINESGVITFYEGKGLLVFGSPGTDLVGKNIFEVYKNHPQLIEPIQRALEGNPLELDIELRGEWFHNHFTPIYHSSGKVSGLVAVSTLITERKRAENALLESNTVLKTILEGIDYPIYLKDRKGKIVICNTAGARSIGLSSMEEVLSQQKNHFPNPLQKKVLEDDLRIMALGKAETYEEKVEVMPGVFKTFFTYKNPYRDSDGRVVGLIGISQDITERKREEEENLLRLQQKVRFQGTRSSRYGVALLCWVVAFVLNFQLEPRLGKSLLFLPLAAIALSSLYGGLVPSLLVIVLTLSGLNFFFFDPRYTFYIASSEDLLRLALFVPVALIISSVGIKLRTAVQKAYETREDAERTLAKMQDEREMRETFVSILTHDLRGPLTVAKSSAELISRFHGSIEGIKKFTTQIIKSVDRADKMIRDLLDVNRIRAGEKIQLEITQCDLRAIIQELVEELTAVHGNRFIIESPSELNGKMAGDEIRRLLENLITNAIKYGSAETPITIRLKKEAGEIVMEVHNEGNELSESEKESMFQIFHRTEKARATGKRGWGIGLTLVKGVAEAHSGTVQVESAPGKGTSFFVKFPN